MSTPSINPINSSASSPPQPAPKKPYTKAGKAFMVEITVWLQDTRLMSEGACRLRDEYEKLKTINFNEASWPKLKKASGTTPTAFTMSPTNLTKRMPKLQKAIWSSRFVFLETLWEEYLQELVLEIRHQDSAIFEPFCERDFMSSILRDVLTNQLESIEDIKQEAATRFASGLTRQSWDEQWKQLTKLKIGLRMEDKELSWYPALNEYFEIRNCIIHAQGRVSATLRSKSPHYANRSKVEIWPNHLDFYRHQFIACLLYIEDKFEARFAAH